jgi:hypothetical protein
MMKVGTGSVRPKNLQIRNTEENNVEDPGIRMVRIDFGRLEPDSTKITHNKDQREENSLRDILF